MDAKIVNGTHVYVVGRRDEYVPLIPDELQRVRATISELARYIPVVVIIEVDVGKFVCIRGRTAIENYEKNIASGLSDIGIPADLASVFEDEPDGVTVGDLLMMTSHGMFEELCSDLDGVIIIQQCLWQLGLYNACNIHGYYSQIKPWAYCVETLWWRFNTVMSAN